MVDWRDGRHHPSVVLQVDAVGLPAAPRARPRVQEEGGSQLVPERQDRARERAGRERPVRALRRAGRAARCSSSGSFASPTMRTACSTTSTALDWSHIDQDRAAHLDREERGRRDPFPGANPLEDRRERRRARHGGDVGSALHDIRVFTTRPDTIFGATYLVRRAGASAARRDHHRTSSATRSPTYRARAAQQDS